MTLISFSIYLIILCNTQGRPAQSLQEFPTQKKLTRLPDNGRRKDLRKPRILHLARDAPALALRAGRRDEDPPAQKDGREQRRDALEQLPTCSHATCSPKRGNHATGSAAREQGLQAGPGTPGSGATGSSGTLPEETTFTHASTTSGLKAFPLPFMTASSTTGTGNPRR